MCRHLKNQDIEKYYFEQFRRDFSLPMGSVEYGDKPDVILRGEKIIGIEITNLYRADGRNVESEQIQAKGREELIRKAQEIYLNKGERNIELNVSFNLALPIYNPGEVAEKLALELLKHDLPYGNLPSEILLKIPPEIKFIYCNTQDYSDFRWRVVQVHSEYILSVDRLKQVIADKNTRISGYKDSGCDEYWLLLIVDFIDLAQDQQLSWPLDKESINTLFDRVIIYKPQFSQWLEIPIKK